MPKRLFYSNMFDLSQVSLASLKKYVAQHQAGDRKSKTGKIQGQVEKYLGKLGS